jgi:serine/threonine-protein kinase
MSPGEVQDRLQRALGTTYAFERELGGGGMSRVFVAEESALGRKVVVKVLRSELAEGLSAERFKREVRLAARLQHPNVVPLLAAGELDDGVLYYTMPFIEGESLRERLDGGGARPLQEAIRLLRDVASALAYAHAQGIVHRDIKPENVLLSHGRAVVADFGIAKAISAAVEGNGGETARRSTLTVTGTSIGTPTYMAPEQAAGDQVDHRADLYALGVLAYEVLTGHPPFEGRSAQQLLAAHATQVPEPVARRRAAVPQTLATLVMSMLEKNPADRPQSADAALAVLDALPDGATTTPLPHARGEGQAREMRRRVPAWVPIGIAAAVLGALVGTYAGSRRGRDSQGARPIIATLTAPPDHEFRTDLSFSLSPDGTRLAFVAADVRGQTSIWIRALDALTASRLDGTEAGTGPFWSPDGTSLGFFSRGRLRVVDLRSGAQRELCAATRPGGATWSPSGVIVYSPDFLGVPLFKVPAAGGACTQLTHYRPGDFDHRRPEALPDGRHALFSSFRGNEALAVDLSTGAITPVRSPGNEAQFAPPNWLLFRDVNGPFAQSGPIYAQPLDLETLRPTGEPVVLLDRTGGSGGLARYSASAHVLVAVRPNDHPWSLVWVNRQSAVTDSVVTPVDAGPIVNSVNVQVSHSGRAIALGGVGLWLHDRGRNVATRVRAQTIPAQGILDPAWSPGDSLIAYGTVFRGSLMLRLYHLGSDKSDSLFALGRRNVRFPDWSPDGRLIAFRLVAGDTVPRDEIWMYSVAERRAWRAFEASGNLSSPRWSPDGRWLAYDSDESGAPEVYVRRVDGKGAPVLVSSAGGELPRWRSDGRELYYRAPDGPIMAVDIQLGENVGVTRPRIVVANPPFARVVRGYEASPDGQRFLGFSRGDPPVFTIFVDWPTHAARAAAR